jgi:hypothetical protein
MKTRTTSIVIRLLAVFILSITPLSAQKFWISNTTGAWGNAANWSTTSGGAGGAGAPLVWETVIFDNNGIGNCTIGANTTVAGWIVNPTYTGTITQGSNSLNITTATFSGGIFSGGTGPITVNNLTISGTNFTSTSNTLSVCNSLVFTSGTFNHNLGTVDINPTCSAGYTFTGSFVFYNLKYSVVFVNVPVNNPQLVLNDFTISSATGGSGALTLNSTIMVNNNLNFVGNSGLSLNGTDTIKVKKDISMSNMNIIGTGVVAMIGTTPQIYNGNSLRGFGTIPNLHIECNGVTFNNVVSFGYNFRHVSGTTNFTTSSTVHWNPLAGFVSTNSNIYGTMNFYKLYLFASWDNLTIHQTITVSDSTIIDLPGGLIPLTLNSPLMANGHVLIIGGYEMVLNGNNFNVRKNFIVNDNSTNAGGGTGTIRFDGSGNQLWDGTTALGQFELPNIIIDKTSGILSIKEFSDIQENWTYIQGLVDANSLGSTVEFDNNSATKFVNASGMSFDNVVVNSSEWNPLTLSSALDVDHDFTITNGGGIVTNNNNINVGDDWTNLNTNATSFVPGTGTVTFDGSNNAEIQMIRSSNRPFYRVVANNTAARISCDEITLFDPMRINNNLNLISGRILSTTANFVQLANGATTNLGNAASYINGPMRYIMGFSGTRTLNFPIGKADKHRPAILNPTHSSATSVTYTGEMFNSSAMALGYALPPTLTHVSYVRYWQIDRQAVANLNTCTATLYYGPDDVVTDPTNLSVAKNIGTGTSWFDMGGVGTAPVTGSITSIPFSTFSRFTLGNRIGGTNPLPVELLFFGAIPQNDQVKLNWTTATEINNDFFTIEKSRDGMAYETVETIEGAGNSNSIINYSTWDNNPYQGTSYYRLKQTDFDNSYKYSDPVSVNFNMPEEITVQVFPNPFTEDLNITVKGVTEEINMHIIDITGRVFYNTVIQPDENYYTTKIKSALFPAAGIYLLQLKYGEKTYITKLIFAQQ